MIKPTINKRTFEMTVCLLALFGLLSYTFVHTGALLARWVNPWGWGYAAALGVELSVVLMSLRIGAMKKVGKRAGWLLFVLIVTLVVSAVANMVEGFYAYTGTQLTTNTISNLDWIQGMVGMLATGFICVVVFALSEVIGTDIDYLAKQAKRSEQADEQASIPANAEPLIPVLSQTSYEQAIYNLLDNGEPPSPTALAKKVNTSKATASKWIVAWQKKQALNAHQRAYAGKPATNGAEYKVVSS